MKILIISTSDCKGGAAVIARALALGMNARGHDVTFLVETQDDLKSGSLAISCENHARKGTLGQRVIHRLGVNQLSLDSEFPKGCQSVRFSDYEIIHLHDLPAFNLRQLPWLTKQAPTIWTIHSMAPLTGNCIYAYDCERWKANCGKCPQFGQWPLTWLHRDGSWLNMRAKRWWYSRSRFHAVGVSQWITARIRESAMGHVPVTTILNAVDTVALQPINKSEAKLRLGIAPESRTIAFSVASTLQDRRKGIDIIVEAVEKMRISNVVWMPMSIGANTAELEQLMSQLGHRMLPPRHLHTHEDLRLYYSAAELVWHPSRADTSSLVSIEAMACGTPVIAASVGGVTEVVGDGGILIRPEDPDELAEVTQTVLSDQEQYEILCQRARKRAEKQFHQDRFLDEHEILYGRYCDAFQRQRASRDSKDTSFSAIA